MKNRNRTILFSFLLLLSIVVNFSYSVSADISIQDLAPSDDDVVLSIGNENYSTNPPGLSFSKIMINESGSWIKFNDTDFNITSSNPINITLSYLNDNFTAASDTEEVLAYTVNSASGLVWFNLSGFKPSTTYTFYRDGGAVQTYSSDSEGNISYSNSVWGSTFSMKQGDQTGSTPTGRTLKITYEHDMLGATYTQGTETIGFFVIIMVFTALGIGLMFLGMIKGGRN